MSPCHQAEKEKFMEAWKCPRTDADFHSLIRRTYCSKHCTSFPVAGYKACWSFWLHLSGVSRARAGPVYLLRVPVCQRVSGKWRDCCLRAPAHTSGWHWASQNCYPWKKKRASRNRLLIFKAAVRKEKQIVLVIFKPRYFLDFKEFSHVTGLFLKGRKRLIIGEELLFFPLLV